MILVERLKLALQCRGADGGEIKKLVEALTFMPRSFVDLQGYRKVECIGGLEDVAKRSGLGWHRCKKLLMDYKSLTIDGYRVDNILMYNIGSDHVFVDGLVDQSYQAPTRIRHEDDDDDFVTWGNRYPIP